MFFNVLYEFDAVNKGNPGSDQFISSIFIYSDRIITGHTIIQNLIITSLITQKETNLINFKSIISLKAKYLTMHEVQVDNFALSIFTCETQNPFFFTLSIFHAMYFLISWRRNLNQLCLMPLI